MPELATTTSIWLILCSVCRDLTAAEAEVEELASYGRTMSLLSLAVGRDERDLEESLDGSRFRAMTVVDGRASSCATNSFADTAIGSCEEPCGSACANGTHDTDCALLFEGM